MFLDPDKLNEASPAEVLQAAAEARLGLDRRFLRALLDRPEQALPAALAFAQRDRGHDRVDLAPELIALFRHWQTPEALPSLIAYIKEGPEDIPDEAMEALVEIGQPALEPLLRLYEELDESESGEVAFLLANLGVREERILRILTDRLEYDASDALFLLGAYGDPAARPAIERAASGWTEADSELKKELAGALEALDKPASAMREPPDPFDIWAAYPETADPDLDLLDEDERMALLDYPVASVRAAAAASFFNRELTPDERPKLLRAAQNDSSPAVRARAWEALMNDTGEPEVAEAMLRAMRNPETAVEERGGLMVGLAAESDRNEVRAATEQLYGMPDGRAKAMEAMWRSLHPTFRNYFAKHLDDADVEVRRAAVWGVGYYGLRGELDRLRVLFAEEELRADALFAYALAVPADLSRGRMKGLLARIEKDAHGLSEMEEELVRTALDERLMLAGKEPFFSREED
ncbi:MAG: HEAT repeat domain-containing protein [Bryobacteraceae bacterium]